MKQIVFAPGLQTERYNCFDRVEMLQPWQGNPIMAPERPWEGDCTAYPCVLHIAAEALYKMWYMTVVKEDPTALDGTVIDNHEMHCERSYVCYAESDDGVAWRRPALDIMRTERYPGNNIVFRDAGFFCGCPTVIYDEQDSDPSRRYKLMIYDNDGAGANGIRTMVSADGLHWRQAGRFPAIGSQDTPSLWLDKKSGTYFAYLKDRVDGQRARLVSRSTDFESWSEPLPCLTPGGATPSTLNFYSQSVFSDHGADFTLISVFDLATQVTELELAAVYDGHCARLPSQPVVLRKGNTGNSWDAGGVYGGNGEPVLRDGLRWVYYGGSNIRHDAFSNQTSVGMASFAPGRLVGQQFENEGFFVTTPILCPGGRLALNADTGSGALLVEVSDSGYGGPIAPYTAGNCAPVSGDSPSLPVTWQGADSLDALAGKYIRLKVSGKNARVYGATFM